ncbi:hypothetical protein PAXINDRAFT_6536 [Paxillus involutus ATCC 200175]|nr:hypothetical protein PAXINDRAFT_6536 [Paxillus involutus ATCC 200175]
MEGYPENTLMPGQQHDPKSRTKGINDLGSDDKQCLLAALANKKLTTRRHRDQHEYGGIIDGTLPVIIGEAPPANSTKQFGRRMFGNGKTNHDGLARLQEAPAQTQSAAATRIKRVKKKAAADASDSEEDLANVIEISDDLPPLPKVKNSARVVLTKRSQSSKDSKGKKTKPIVISSDGDEMSTCEGEEDSAVQEVLEDSDYKNSTDSRKHKAGRTMNGRASKKHAQQTLGAGPSQEDGEQDTERPTAKKDKGKAPMRTPHPKAAAGCSKKAVPPMVPSSSDDDEFPDNPIERAMALSESSSQVRSGAEVHRVKKEPEAEDEDPFQTNMLDQDLYTTVVSATLTKSMDGPPEPLSTPPSL